MLLTAVHIDDNEITNDSADYLAPIIGRPIIGQSIIGAPLILANICVIPKSRGLGLGRRQW